MVLLSLGSESVQQIQERPKLLPWFLGFLLALFLLNLAFSYFRKRGAGHHKKTDSPEEKQQKP